MHSPTFPIIFTSFCLITLPSLTSTSPLPPPLTPPNTTFLATPSHSIQCIESPHWTTIRFLPGDCYTCLDKLRHRDVDRYGDMVLEFLAKGVPPSAELRFVNQVTPRRWRYKSCEVAVAMVGDVEGVAVPNTPHPLSDLATYVSIELAVKNIIERCLSVVAPAPSNVEDGRRGDAEERRRRGVGGGDGDGGGGGGGVGGGGGRLGFANPAGWATLGIHHSLGVFIFDTNSAMDHVVFGESGFASQVGVGRGRNGSEGDDDVGVGTGKGDVMIDRE